MGFRAAAQGPRPAGEHRAKNYQAAYGQFDITVGSHSNLSLGPAILLVHGLTVSYSGIEQT